MSADRDYQQCVKFEMKTKSFEENLRFMRQEGEDEMRKTLLAGASAYASSMQKHTPPNLGKKEIPAVFYADGVLYTQQDDQIPSGLRPILDLKQLVRGSGRVKFRSLYGKMLQQGYFYMVKIMRGGKVKQKWCRTYEEAQRYAHISYRGLLRASWGISFRSISNKIPPAFRSLVEKRPDIENMSSLNDFAMNPVKREIVNTNKIANSSDSWFGTADVNASIAAVSTMDDRMTKYFKKKYNL